MSVRATPLIPPTCLAVAVLLLAACGRTPRPDAVWEADNLLQRLPFAPLGVPIDLARLPDPPTPARIRLGRWLFFDKRLSRDGSMSCASCHEPAHAFSNAAAVATGIGGQQGTRKVPTIINLAIPVRWSSFADAPPGAFFWDGRARTLEEQALEPIANPIEMASSHGSMVASLSRVAGYAPYFAQAFGDRRVTKERVARAIADYERTRMSGSSPFDRWHVGREEGAVSVEVKRGFALFSGKAGCVGCHRPPFFTDGQFHNIGIGWNAATRTFADPGRHAVTRGTVFEAEPGTFKTPTLREVTRHAPYMHDGSISTLREVVEFYNRGANPNPDLAFRLREGPRGLTAADIDAIVAFLHALEGHGWQDAGPSRFPQ